MPDTFQRVAEALAGRYRIERELGAGGMATVYLAFDVKHHRKVAVKVLRPELAAALGGDRFTREIETAAQFQHPHVLPLLDSGEASGFLYYVMPYVEGESLRDRLARHGELPIHDAVKILIEITDALAYAHAHGVVHRDIKPDNVLLSGRHALVMDFGVAKALSEATGRRQLTTAGIALGTPAYMAPEQAAADPHVDHRVDIYAVGVLGYELIAGRPPFTAGSTQEVLAAHVSQPPEPVTKWRPACPPALAEIIMKCLEKRPADRWQTADDLLAQLEPLATPSGGTTPTGMRPPAAQPHRAAGPRGVVAAVVLIAVGAVVAVLLRSRPSVLELGRRTPVTLDPGLELDPALSPDGKLVAYVAGTPGETRLLVRQVDGGTPVAVVSEPGGQRFPFWTPDGKRIMYQAARGIEIVPALGGTPRLLIAASGSSLLAGPVAPDGRSFLYLSGDSLYVRPLEGGAPRAIVTGKELHSPAWSPDGRRIAYVVGNVGFVTTATLGNIAASSIWVVSAEAGAPIRVTDDQSLNVSPAWAPGPIGLLYISTRDGGPDVYQVALTGSGRPRGSPVRLTTGLGARGISVSADGRRLAYAVFAERSNVWSFPLPAPGAEAVSIARAVPLTLGNQTIETVALSPDGEWLAFDSDRSGAQQIYRVRLAGGEPEQVTSESAGAFFPRWSPDGREISYHSFREGLRRVFVLPAEGGTPVQVATGPDDLSGAQWSPDGRRLLLLANMATSNPTWDVVTRQADRSWSAPRRLPVVIGPDTTQCGIGDWSPDGRLIACICRPGLVVLAATGGPGRLLARAPSPTFTAQWAPPQWSSDGRLIYYLTADSAGVHGVSAVPVTGGAPRIAIRFDDPTRPWHRYGFFVSKDRFYFTLGDLQSDIWVAELGRR